MLSRIIAAIVAFFVCLFPFLQKPTFIGWEATANNLMSAVKENDIDALEAMMCKNIKDNVPDLPDEISNMLDAIDGEIVDFTWRTMGGYNANHGGGKSLSQKHLIINFTTSNGSYRFGMVWEYYNSFQPEEQGIRNIGLSQDGNTLALIKATNGVGEWHE